MVVLAAAVVTKSGEPIISRQFRDMPRSRIEGLLATFPKIRPAAAQHTMCETDAIRYLYRPLDDHHILVLLTNRTSNIIQDLGTLQLFTRVVADVCPPRGGTSAGGWSKSDLKEHAFELAEAFDECVSVGGYREHVSAQQVGQILEMDSHEEKIQEIIARNKEKEVKEEGKRRAKELEAQRREQMRKGMPVSGGGFGSSSSSSAYNRPTEPVSMDYERRPSPAPQAMSVPKGKGMQLGKKKALPGADLFSGGLDVDIDVAEPSHVSAASARFAEPEPEPEREPIHVEIEERLHAVSNRDGGLDSFECRGSLVLRISDPSLTRLCLTLDTSMVDTSDIQFKLHPNMDKKIWASDRVIQLKDLNRGFPVNQGLAVVKWRAVGKDESSLPLILNCWPQMSPGGGCDVNIEYELEHEALELDEVTITIPIPSGTKPELGDYDGIATFDRSKSCIEWSPALITPESKTGSLEFSVTEGVDDVDQFFPVEVAFRAVKGATYTGIQVTECRLVDGDIAEFGLDVLVQPDEYSVV